MSQTSFPLLDIPLPTKPASAKSPAGRKLKYPIDTLEVGGKCMFVPAALSVKVRQAAARHGVLTGKQFVVRKLPDSADFGCWRIEDMTAERHEQAKAAAQVKAAARAAKKVAEAPAPEAQ